MPVFNERATVEAAIASALEADLPTRQTDLIVIDDGSTDGSRELLERTDWPANVRVLFHDSNLGKGAAIRTGLSHASGQYTAVLDADLEYDANEIGLLLPRLADGATAVFGVRRFRAGNSFSFLYVLGNKVVTLAANVLYKSRLTDLMTCHKVIRTDVFQSLPLRETGFAIEAEIAAHLIRRGIDIHEVPISYMARAREEGKKLKARDGLRVLRTLVRCRFDGTLHFARN
jgi:glycosyltransferase involved in cell wall biosynthesis